MATVAGSLRNKVLVLDDVTTGDLTVTGSVTIAGTATTLNSTNTSINDHLIELNAGLTGSNPNDTGLILERGSTGNNVFIGWDESTDKVMVATTTADGTATGNLSLTAANFQAADVTMSSATSSGKITINATEGLEVGGIRGRSIGSQSGDYIHLYERVHIGYHNGWGANVATAPAQGLGTWGGINVGIGGSGVLQIAGTTVIDASRNIITGSNLYFGATDSSLLAKDGANIKYMADGIHKFYTYDSGWIERARINDSGLELYGNATVSGSLTFNGTAVYNALNMANNNIVNVNNISISDPGPNEGVQWSNIKIFESPNDLTTNSSGNFQVVYGSTRRLTVNSTGIDVNGRIDLTNSGYISFYGNGSEDHSIGAYLDDDIRINSYGGVFISLDSNGNNDSAADFLIGKHAGASTAFGTNDQLFKIRGDGRAGDVITVGNIGLGATLSYPKVAYPGAEAQWSASGTSTGQIIIDLPGTLSNYDMMYMEIDIYEYSGDAATKLIIGGHNWNSGGNSNTGSTMWHNTDVRVLGEFQKPIYFGWRNNGSVNKRVIVLGDPSSSWSYGTVHVAKVSGAVSFYTAGIDWTGDWNVTQSTSSSAYTKSPSTDFNGADRRVFRVIRAIQGNRIYADADMRSPIYYDLNDTTYRADPASTSKLKHLDIGHTDSTVGIFKVYDTGNNGLELKSTGSNAFQFDMVGTSATGELTFNDLNIDITGGHFLNNITVDIGNSGNDSFIELKNTGYTGNVTSLRQNADSSRAELNSTERSILIQAGSDGGSTGAEVRLYANQSEGLRVVSGGHVEIPAILRHIGDTDTYMQFTDGEIDFFANGRNGFMTSSGGFVVNPGLHNYDFIVRGDNESNLIYGDASTDRVGIGTASPSYDLDIYGASAGLRVARTANDASIISKSTTAGAWFISESPNYYSGILHNIGGTEQWALGTLQGQSQYTLRRGRSGAVVLTALTDGKVGINNNTPQRRFVVTESSAGGAGDNSGILSLTVGSGANTDSKMAFGIDSSHRGWIHVVKPGNNVFPLLLNPTGSSNGKVGIGVSGNPGAMLDVEGGALGGTSGNSVTAAIIRAGRQNLVFKDTRTANGTDWNNATFKMIAQIDSTNHQSIDFVNDGSYNEHIDILTGNQVFNTRFTHNGMVGIGTNDPALKLDVLGQINVQSGQVWSETTQGGGRGSIHIDPNSATDHAGGAITFGASDTSNGTNSHAGIYVRSDGSYGTKMYFSTTDSYGTGSKTGLRIDHAGVVSSIRSRIESASDMRASIFYDTANTSYFLDPANTGQSMTVAGSITVAANTTSAQFYTSGWFRNNDSGDGLYNQATGQHWYSDDDDYWNVAGGGAANGIRFRDDHGSTIRGYVYANNSNEIGFLDASAHWAVRHKNDSFTEFRVNNVAKATIDNDGIKLEGDLGNGHQRALRNSANLAGANLLTAATDIARRYGNGSQREFRTFVDGNKVACHYSQGVNNSATCYQWISTEWIDVDPEKDYEYSIWVQAEGDHNVYMGWHERNASGSTITSNPYFHTSTVDTNGGWVKLTARLKGHRTPAGTSDTEGTDRYASNNSWIDEGSGVSSNDGVMHSTTRRIMMRFGTCYGTANTAKTYFYLPSIREISYENAQQAFIVPNIQNNIVQAGSMHIGRTDWNGYTGLEYRDCSGNQEFRISSNSGSVIVRSDGAFYANNDMRAPHYYDLDDTNYYTNPASTSHMNAIYLADGLYHKDDSDTCIKFTANEVDIDAGGTNVLAADSSVVKINRLRVNQGSSVYTGQTNVDESILNMQTDFNAQGSQNLQFVNHNGNWLDGTSGADTAYGWMWGYENSIRAGIHYDHRSSEKFDFYSSYGEIRFRTPASVSGNISPIGSESSMPARLTIGVGGAVTAANDMRAPIFYDSNDTTYYTNPASTSLINGLQMSGSLLLTAEGATNIKTRFIMGKASGNTNSGELYLNYGQNHAVYIGSGGTASLHITGNQYMTDSDQHIELGSYLKLYAATASNTGTIAINANYGGAQTDSWTPDYSGDANAGMWLLRQSSGGSGIMQVLQKKHGTTGGSHARSSFTKTAEFHHDGYFYGRNLRSEIYYDSSNTAYYVDPYDRSFYRLGNPSTASGDAFNGDVTNRRGLTWYHTVGPDMTIWGYGAATGQNAIRIWAAGSTGTTNGDKFEFKHDGSLHADGDITAFSTTTASDIRLKENVRDLEGSLDKTLQLRGVKFDWKEEGKGNDQLGFIAQEIEEVLPEVVNEADSLNPTDENFKVVNYQAVVPVLVEAIKELKAEIDELKEQLKKK